MPPLSILLKPASSACNLRCTYCFYADEAGARAVPNYGLMSNEVSRALIEKAAGVAEGSISFLFQGGEPTLAGLDFSGILSPRRDRGSREGWRCGTPSRPTAPCWIGIGAASCGKTTSWWAFPWTGTGPATIGSAGTGRTRAPTIKCCGLPMLEEGGVEFNVLTVVTGYLARHIQSAFSSLCRQGFRFQQYIPCLDPWKRRGAVRNTLCLLPGMRRF